MDKNDSRIPVLFSLTSSCTASFAAFKGKVLEACGLSCRKKCSFFLRSWEKMMAPASLQICATRLVWLQEVPVVTLLSTHRKSKEPLEWLVPYKG